MATFNEQRCTSGVGKQRHMYRMYFFSVDFHPSCARHPHKALTACIHHCHQQLLTFYHVITVWNWKLNWQQPYFSSHLIPCHEKRIQAFCIIFHPMTTTLLLPPCFHHYFLKFVLKNERFHLLQYSHLETPETDTGRFDIIAPKITFVRQP